MLEVVICSSHLTRPWGQLSQCSCRFCRCWGCQPCQALVSVCRVWHLEDRHLFKRIDGRIVVVGSSIYHGIKFVAVTVVIVRVSDWKKIDVVNRDLGRDAPPNFMCTLE